MEGRVFTFEKEVTYKNSKHNKRQHQSQVEKFLGVLLGMVIEITPKQKTQSVLKKEHTKTHNKLLTFSHKKCVFPSYHLIPTFNPTALVRNPTNHRLANTPLPTLAQNVATTGSPCPPGSPDMFLGGSLGWVVVGSTPPKTPRMPVQ